MQLAARLICHGHTVGRQYGELLQGDQQQPCQQPTWHEATSTTHTPSRTSGRGPCCPASPPSTSMGLWHGWGCEWGEWGVQLAVLRGLACAVDIALQQKTCRQTPALPATHAQQQHMLTRQLQPQPRPPPCPPPGLFLLAGPLQQCHHVGSVRVVHHHLCVCQRAACQHRHLVPGHHLVLLAPAGLEALVALLELLRRLSLQVQVRGDRTAQWRAWRWLYTCGGWPCGTAGWYQIDPPPASAVLHAQQHLQLQHEHSLCGRHNVNRSSCPYWQIQCNL
jgi:hypothetical protein